MFKSIFLCLCSLGSKALRNTLFYQGFKLGIAAIKDKVDLKKRLHSALAFLQKYIRKECLFQLQDTKYTAQSYLDVSFLILEAIPSLTESGIPFYAVGGAYWNFLFGYECFLIH